MHPTIGNFVVFRSVYEAEGRLWADAIRVAPAGEIGVRAGTSIPRFREEDLPPGTTPRAREVFRGMETFADGITGHQAVRTGRHLEHEIQGIVDQREEQFEALNGGE